ncbi:MAG: LysE family transporter [Neisseriaceae bacterium]|nr:LysE family transporter [Neisseriaceae bacterium]
MPYFSDIKYRKHFNQQTTILPQNNKNMFLQGFAVAIANPKDVIFFMAFFPQFIGITTNASFSLLILTCLWILLDFSLLSLYALLMNSKRISSFKFYISIISDVVLILIGVLGIVLSLRYFLS